MTDNNIKPSSLLIGNGSNAPSPTPLKTKLLVSLAIFSLIGGLFGGALFIRSKASSEDTFLYVDTINCSQINGWAYTGQKPTGGAKLAIYFYEAPKSGGPISGTSALTNINRPDVNLARGLIGDHGYDIAVPPELPQDKEIVVEVLLVVELANKMTLPRFPLDTT